MTEASAGAVARGLSFAMLGVAASAVISLAGCQGEPGRPNVLVIVLDTVRADHLSTYGYPVETSPNLSALAARGVRFDDVVSTAPWTLPSHASLFTGLVPAEHGATHEHRALSPDAVTLAERFRDAGWRTAGFSTNPNVSAATRLDQGFEHFSFIRGTGREVTDETLEFLRGTPEPWFVFVNYLDAHLPYSGLPEEIRLRFMPDTPSETRLVALSEQANAPYYACGLRAADPVALSQLILLYDAALTHLDGLLGELLDGLGDRGDDTLIVVLSDHGELLGERGLVEHQFSVLEPLIQIPLVVALPGRVPAGQVADTPLSLTQVHGMILRLAGLEADDAADVHGIVAGAEQVSEYYSPAHLLRGLRETEPDCADRLSHRLTSVRRGDLKLVWGSDGTLALHDLALDPDEQIDIASDHPGQVESLVRIVEKRQRRYADLESRPPVPDLDDETREQLRRLGYLTDPD